MKKLIQDAGLQAEVYPVIDDQTAEGYVKSCEPKEGSEVAENSVVKIFVSKGPAVDEIEVPSVIDKDLDAAKTDILAAGLTIGDIKEVDDSDKAAGIDDAFPPRQRNVPAGLGGSRTGGLFPVFPSVRPFFQ